MSVHVKCVKCNHEVDTKERQNPDGSLTYEQWCPRCQAYVRDLLDGTPSPMTTAPIVQPSQGEQMIALLEQILAEMRKVNGE